MNHSYPPDKYCPACRVWKPRAEFTVKPCASDGRREYCRSCSKARNLAYNEKRKAVVVPNHGEWLKQQIGRP